MKHWRITVIIFILIIVATACKNEPGPADEQTNQDHPDQDTIQLSEALSELSIWQIYEDQTSEEIIAYPDGTIESPVTLAVHAPEAVIKLALLPHLQIDIDQVKPLIRIEGADYDVAEGAEQHGIEVTVRNIDDEAELYLGDLKKIELRRTASHLHYMLNQSSLRVPYSLLIPSEGDGRSHIFVSDEEDSVVLRFTEPMDRIERPGSEWLSDTQLRIDLGENDALEFPIDEYYSDEGNFIARKFKSVMIHKTPSRSWFDAASGGNVGWSNRDSYYDALLFSPDGSKYAGIVQLSEEEDDAGVYYGIVIEQNGQAPIVVEHTLHTRARTGLMSVQWLNNETLLYLSSFRIWAYDVGSGMSREVTANGEDIQTIAFQYDQRSGRLYELTQVNKLQDGKEYLQGGMSIYDANLELVERIDTISDLWPSAENGSMPLAIAVQRGGYYMTTYRDGQTVTYYRSNGDEDAAPGRLIGMTDDGAYLASTDETADGMTRLYWWPRGGDSVQITALADASYIMFGGDLFARLEGVTDVYYGYSRSRDEWVEWSPNDGRDSWIPNQRTAYYRVAD